VGLCNIFEADGDGDPIAPSAHRIILGIFFPYTPICYDP